MDVIGNAAFYRNLRLSTKAISPRGNQGMLGMAPKARKAEVFHVDALRTCAINRLLKLAIREASEEPRDARAIA